MTNDRRRYIESNPQNCSGCRLCELVCSTKHNPGMTNSKKARIRVVIEHRENKNDPRVCRQCPEHPCLEACPVEAIRIPPGRGIPIVEAEVCTGCRACVEACPGGFMYFDEDANAALKCDFCGGDPECVKNCPQNAIFVKTAE